ncbi:MULTISPECIES: transporter [Vibrio]|uniref:transporter n=1 Tax=Vibrio TaxID=662 RepID=UPI0021A36296|nr:MULTISPECIES: transporter [Vibrio]MDA0147390.1 transporter [Vibrio sp. LaRot3]
MEHQGKACVVFDYTSFLGASCSKKWTFLEAISSIAPIFGLAWKDGIKSQETAEERLWNQAMKSLSASRSDESNIHTLLKLAKTEGIHEIKLVMPYELEQEQIERLKKRSKVDIQNLQQDELMITF